jgi:hypothetical protein
MREESKHKQTKLQIMNDQFDELAMGMAQSVTRRGALKRFGLSVASIALTCLGLANKAEARIHCQCKKPYHGCRPDDTLCILICAGRCE